MKKIQVHKKKPRDLSSLRSTYPEVFDDVPWRPRWSYSGDEQSLIEAQDRNKVSSCEQRDVR
jgi:hypothetical protein